MTQTTADPDAVSALPKGPAARLLDLVLGWAEFVGESGQAPDPALSAEELQDLYQEAGAALIPLAPEEEPAAVEAFVRERVLPLLLRAPGGGEGRGERDA